MAPRPQRRRSAPPEIQTELPLILSIELLYSSFYYFLLPMFYSDTVKAQDLQHHTEFHRISENYLISEDSTGAMGVQCARWTLRRSGKVLREK